jgi:YgiT-type zinc finger domain-containing protein
MSDPEKVKYPCIDCQAGMLSRRYVTYFTWLGEELITVQNFPAWVCDVCGKREYDHQAVMWVNMLLNPDAGKPTPRARRKTRAVLKSQQPLHDAKH